MKLLTDGRNLPASGTSLSQAEAVSVRRQSGVGCGGIAKREGSWRACTPKPGVIGGRPRVLTEEAVLALCELRKQLKGASLSVALREARLKDIIGRDCKVSSGTIYRLFKQRGLMSRQEVLEDRRRFEAELLNDIWQQRLYARLSRRGRRQAEESLPVCLP